MEYTQGSKDCCSRALGLKPNSKFCMFCGTKNQMQEDSAPKKESTNGHQTTIDENRCVNLTYMPNEKFHLSVVYEGSDGAQRHKQAREVVEKYKDRFDLEHCALICDGDDNVINLVGRFTKRADVEDLKDNIEALLLD